MPLMQLRTSHGYTGGFSSPQPRRQRDSTRPSAAAPRIPQEHFHITRAHFAVLKATHHLAHLNTEVPKTLLRTATDLASLLRPAFPSDTFKAKASRVADSWLSHSLEALREHYTEVRDSALALIRSSPISADLRDFSLSVSQRWARNQLGRKLAASSIAAAHSLIVQQQALQHEDPNPAPAPRRSVSTQTQVSSPLPAELPHRASQASEAAVRPSPPQPSTSPLPAEAAATELTSQASEPPLAAAAGSQATAARTPQPQRQPRARKRPLSLSQTDLLGNRIAHLSPPAQRAASLPRLQAAPSWEENVIFGDANLREFDKPATTVLAHTNGRLSHFKSLLADTRVPCPAVKRFVLCLSPLDKDNSPSTNASALKSLLGAAHRVFPQAALAVQLVGIAGSFSAAQKETLQALNSFVLNKAPSSCSHIPTATDFTVTDGLGDERTKAQIFAALSSFLR